LERIKELVKILKSSPATAIRYVMVVAGVFVSFHNLFDCIVKSMPIESYILYVGVTGICTLLLIFIPDNIIVCFVLCLFGALMIFDDKTCTLNCGGMFMIFSKRIANSLFVSLLIYMSTVIAVVANQTVNNRTPSDSVNTIIGYLSIFILDYIISGDNK